MINTLTHCDPASGSVYPLAEGVMPRVQPYVRNCLCTVVRRGKITQFVVFFKCHHRLPLNLNLPAICNSCIRGDVIVMRVGVRTPFVNFRGQDSLMSHWLVKRCVYYFQVHQFPNICYGDSRDTSWDQECILLAILATSGKGSRGWRAPCKRGRKRCIVYNEIPFCSRFPFTCTMREHELHIIVHSTAYSSAAHSSYQFPHRLRVPDHLHHLHVVRTLSPIIHDIARHKVGRREGVASIG
jgi:hypothetical protein